MNENNEDYKNKLLILLRNCMEEKNIRRKNMERIYNKLVRDNIPNIIKEKGEEPITRILSDEEYKKELEKEIK